MADRRDSKNRKLNKGEYQRNDGRYAYRYIDVDGIERWIYSWRLTDTDRPPAGKEYTESLREMEIRIAQSLTDGIKIYDAEKTTLNECFETYLSTKIKIKDVTRVSYRKLWSYYIKETIGRRYVSDLHYSTLVRFFGGLISGGLKQSSVEQVFSVVKPALDLAVRDNLLKSNPAIGVMNAIKTKDGYSEHRHALTQEQQEAFLSFLERYPRHRRLFRLIIFLIGTGCRIGEARGLTWNDCDFDRKVIFIDRQMQYYKATGEEKHREHITTVKCKSSRRMIPMFNAVRDVLFEEKDDQEALGIHSVDVDGLSGFIFIKTNGSVIEVADAFRAIDNAVKEYNRIESDRAKREGRQPVFVPHFSPHNLRHTFCTRLYENEPNMKLVQEVMGHSNISTTMDIYTDIGNATKIKNFELLEGKVV